MIYERIGKENMKYYSGYYYQEQKETSLILLQAYCSKTDIPVLFACIVEKHMVEGLSNWFYGIALENLRKRKLGGWNRLQHELQRVLHQTYSGGIYTGFFCAGERFFRFANGEGKSFVINKKNSKSNFQELACTKIEQGVLQEGIAVFLSTANYVEKNEKSFWKALGRWDQVVAEDREEWISQVLARRASKVLVEQEASIAIMVLIE